MNNKLKKTLIASLVVGATSFSASALAASSSPSVSNGSAGMTSVLSKIYGVLQTAVDTANTRITQFDEYMTGMQNPNAASSSLSYTSSKIPAGMPTLSDIGASNYVSYAASVHTSTNNIQTLYQIPSVVNPPKNNSAAESIAKLFPNLPAAKAKPPTQTKVINSLTTYLPAADSLFAPTQSFYNAAEDDSNISKDDLALLKPPGGFSQNGYSSQQDQYHNSVFNASTFLFPPNGSYTPSTGSSSTTFAPYSKTAANTYLTFLSQDYLPVSNGVNFGALTNPNPNGNQSGEQVKALAIATLKMNPTYKNYQLAIRNLVSSRSMLMTMMNQLAAERTPYPGLGTKAGLQGTPYVNKDGSASPMQIENYDAYHLVNDPKWYAYINTASPAVVQRQTLYVLAQILAKMQQAHIDREKQLAVSTLQSFETIQGLQKLVQTDSQKLNKVICSLPGIKSKQCSSTTTTSSADNPLS